MAARRDLEFMLRHAGSNWVTGGCFFDRETELQALDRRVRDACARDGFLSDESVKDLVGLLRRSHSAPRDAFRNLLRVLDHEGYLATESGGHSFVSGPVEDWWRKGHVAVARPSRSRAPAKM